MSKLACPMIQTMDLGEMSSRRIHLSGGMTKGNQRWRHQPERVKQQKQKKKNKDKRSVQPSNLLAPINRKIWIFKWKKII